MADSSQQKSQAGNPLVGSPNRWTVMILRGMGEMRSFRISTRLIFWLLLFMGLYVAASVLVINQYFVELRAHKTQVALLNQLQHEIDRTQKELYRSRQQLSMLKDHFLKDTPATQARAAPDEETRGAAVPGGPDPLEVHAPPNSLMPREGENRQEPAEIRDLAVRKAGARLEVRFRLVNNDSRKEQLRGYVHIIAVETASDPPQIWTYPKVALREGEPVDFKSGYTFSIRNYIDIKAKMFLSKESDSPSELRLLVYDESGALILRRTFDIV
jgi:hypothetical protein